MTPELRQAIQLLQYNSLELHEYLEKELEENPLLEMENVPTEIEHVEIEAKEPDIDWKEYLERYDDISYKKEKDKNLKDYNLESFTSYEPTLKDYLIGQLRLIKTSEKEYIIAEYIINNIDDNGYLITSLEEIAEFASTNISEVEAMLQIIQTFEPNGVGARNLKECLLLQIKNDDNQLINHIIHNHLEDIGNNRIAKIAKENNLDIQEMQSICDYIKTLEPKPGRVFRSSSENVKYIIPDATIQVVDGEYIILVNDYTGPRLNINNYYKNMLNQTGDKQIFGYLQNKLNSAMWIIKSIEQRRNTIYKVVESILKFQNKFFKDGEMFLVPITLKDIALDIDMHESTISRATNGKYVQTPRGLYELKYFFTVGLSSSDGDVSSTSVKAMIKDLIEKEDPKKPLSDQQISNQLEERGTRISRRTVAKYRDELNIAASSLRKRY